RHAFPMPDTYEILSATPSASSLHLKRSGDLRDLHSFPTRRSSDLSERLAAMGQMIGGFAHELNNPLTSIMGVAELLQENESSAPVRKQLAMLQPQARRAAGVVQNIMYVSRPPSPGNGTINLAELIHRTLHFHAYSLRQNHI